MRTKIIFVILAIGLIDNLFAQNEIDALRYSQTNFGGTARSIGMAGSFGALGGDFGSLSVNPAGIAVYRSNEFVISPEFAITNSEASYLNSVNSDNRSKMSLSNIGLISSYLTEGENTWVSFNFGVGYNRNNNFNRNVMIEGINTNGSMIDYFRDQANGFVPNDLNYFNEGLAFNTFLIDTASGNNLLYNSALSGYLNKPSTYGETQRRIIDAKGSMGEYLFVAGANFKNKLYIGATIGIQNVRYEEHSEHKEFDPLNQIPDFKDFTFTQNLETTGSGMNFNLGFLLRPVEFVRIGASFHTPTYLKLSDAYSSSMVSHFDNGDNYSDESLDGNYDYELSTPMRATGSLGFIIQQIALLNIDYEYVDYSTPRLRSDNDNFYDQNKAIEQLYTAASNLKVGAEVRYADFAFRGGFAYYGSPYKSASDRKDASKTFITAGMGFRSDDFFLDFAFVHSLQSETIYLYNVYDDQPLVNADITNTSNKISVTLGLKF